jgi:hypothetical protein
MGYFDPIIDGYDRGVEGRLEEIGKGKGGVLKINNLGGRGLKIGGKAGISPLPSKGGVLGKMVRPNFGNVKVLRKPKFNFGFGKKVR